MTVVKFDQNNKHVCNLEYNTAIAQDRTWDIFIRDTAYPIVIQWNIMSYIIESQWNVPYPVWTCLSYGTTQTL